MRFCHFLGVCLFFASLGKSPVVASWQSDFLLAIQVHQDLLWFAWHGSSTYATCASTQ